MLAQVILVMRTPFKSQGAIWAEEGAHSSVNTLMNLDLNTHTDVRSVFSLFFEAFICLVNITLVYLKQRGAFESFAAVLTLVRLLSRVGPAKEK